MTERELYERNIPIIAQITVECRKLNEKEYEDFKRATLESAPKEVGRFVRKVFIVIEKYLAKG